MTNMEQEELRAMKHYLEAKAFGEASPGLFSKLERKEIKERVLNTKVKSISSWLRKNNPAALEVLNQRFERPFWSRSPYMITPVLHGLLGLTSKTKCLWCGKTKERFGDVHCSVACTEASGRQKLSDSMKAQRKNETAKQKRQRQLATVKTNMAKFGTKTPAESAEVRAKIKKIKAERTPEDRKAERENCLATMRERYGVDAIMHVPEVYERVTKKQRMVYATRNAEIQALRRKRSLAKYGVEHQIYRDEVRQKITKYRKIQIKVRGVTYMCQGFEPIAIRLLADKGYRISTQCSGIPYKRHDGTQHRYYPDLKAIKGDRRLLIEVKSDYTFNWTKSNCPEKFFAGTRYAQTRNVDYVIFVIFPGRCIKVIENPTRLSDLKLKAAKEISITEYRYRPEGT